MDSPPGDDQIEDDGGVDLHTRGNDNPVLSTERETEPTDLRSAITELQANRRARSAVRSSQAAGEPREIVVATHHRRISGEKRLRVSPQASPAAKKAKLGRDSSQDGTPPNAAQRKKKNDKKTDIKRQCNGMIDRIETETKMLANGRRGPITGYKIVASAQHPENKNATKSTMLIKEIATARARGTEHFMKAFRQLRKSSKMPVFDRKFPRGFLRRLQAIADLYGISEPTYPVSECSEENEADEDLTEYEDSADEEAGNGGKHPRRSTEGDGGKANTAGAGDQTFTAMFDSETEADDHDLEDYERILAGQAHVPKSVLSREYNDTHYHLSTTFRARVLRTYANEIVLDQQNKELTTQLADARTAHQDLQTQHQQLRDEQTRLEDENKQLNTQLADAEKAHEDLETELADARTAHQDLQTQHQQLRDEQTRLEVENKKLKTQLADAEKAHEDLETELADARTAYQDLQTQHQQVCNKVLAWKEGEFVVESEDQMVEDKDNKGQYKVVEGQMCSGTQTSLSAQPLLEVMQKQAAIANKLSKIAKEEEEHKLKRKKAEEQAAEMREKLAALEASMSTDANDEKELEQRKQETAREWQEAGNLPFEPNTS